MTESNKVRELWNGWQPPRELERSRPRPVRFTAKGKVTVVVAAALLAGGVVGAAALYRKALEQRERGRPAKIERADRTPPWVAPLVFIAMAGGSLLVVLKLTRERRLLEEGHVAPGIVTKLGARTDKGRKVYYEFATYSGATVKGKYGPVHGKWVLPVGSPIVVLYDRDEPKRNTRYPSSLVTLDV